MSVINPVRSLVFLRAFLEEINKMSDRTKRVAKGAGISVATLTALLFAFNEAFDRIHTTAKAEASAHASHLESRIDKMESALDGRLNRIEGRIDALLLHEGIRLSELSPKKKNLSRQ